MKKVFAFTALLLVLLASPASAISASQSEAISDYCGNIKQVLRLIQRDDSRARINVGATYEIISSHYITPLNLRLVSNNIASPELISLQTDFVSLRSDFSSKFIEYSRSFDQLLATNCESDPEIFYSRLESVRDLRSQLNTLTASLGQKAHAVATTAESLKGELEHE